MLQSDLHDAITKLAFLGTEFVFGDVRSWPFSARQNPRNSMILTTAIGKGCRSNPIKSDTVRMKGLS